MLQSVATWLKQQRPTWIELSGSVLILLIGLPAVYYIIAPLLDQFIEALAQTGSKDQSAIIRNLGLAIVAIIGAPFLVWRTLIAAKQADTAEQGLITDRINTAVAGLGAEKTVKHDDKETTEPNLEVRIGAIYALERIAQDSDRDHIRIMEILCAYIRNNSPIANAVESPQQVFDRLSSISETYPNSPEQHPKLSAQEIMQNLEFLRANAFCGWNPSEFFHSDPKDWAKCLPPPRPDIAAALSIISRRTKEQTHKEKNEGFTINLSKTNLQNCQLKGDFTLANLSHSALDGATLEGDFSKCNFSFSTLQVTYMKAITASLADFSRANLDSAEMGYSNYDGCRFWFCQMDRTGLNGTSMLGTDWYGAKKIDVFFYSDADLSHSRLMETDITKINGLLGGPTKALWIDSKVTMTTEQEQSHPKSKIMESELDFRRLWHEKLNSESIEFFS